MRNEHHSALQMNFIVFYVSLAFGYPLYFFKHSSESTKKTVFSCRADEILHILLPEKQIEWKGTVFFYAAF